MATVELLLSPLPVHVRTARLVSVAAARRAGLGAEPLDELRLAVGEACSRAVAAARRSTRLTQPVQLLLRDDATGLTVEVVDRGPESGPVDGDVEDLFGEDEVDPRVVAGGHRRRWSTTSTVTPSSTGTSVRAALAARVPSAP